MCLHNLLLLLCLSKKQTMRKKPLVDYSQSQVMIYIKYLNIQREKKYEQGNCKGNQRRKTKGKGSQVIEKKTTNLGSTTNQATQRVVKKHA